MISIPIDEIVEISLHIFAILLSLSILWSVIKIILQFVFPWGIYFEFKKKPKKEKYIEPWDIPDTKL